MKISAVVLTKNEEENIEKCIKSLSFCDEIIIIDDNSTDETISKIRMLNAKCQIYSRDLGGDFASQRNFGLQKANGDWVLFIDADETVSKKLADEIIKQIKVGKAGVNGNYFKREDIFLGKKLKHGETGSVKLLRLAKKDKGTWKRKVHEEN